MSGGTLIVWLRVCSASIGVPAAIRPMTGTATGRSPSSALAPPRTLPRLPSITLGVKPRRLPPPGDNSGSLITSIARARFGRRRMNPRSSSAVINRWMPDFDRRSSASFISSKEGGTPASFSRSLMKRRSSYCLRVSISSKSPGFDGAVRFRDFDLRKGLGAPAPVSCDGSAAPVSCDQILELETNHERTLYVRYVFRNHLISGEREKSLAAASAGALSPITYFGSRRISQVEPALAAGASGARTTSACAAARFASSEES